MSPGRKKKKPFVWEPWEEWRPTEDDEMLPMDGLLLFFVEEPPCQHCLHWRPTRTYDQAGCYSGVQCCNAPNMEADFSCFSKQPPMEEEED
jgi:hypothetical protein